MALTPEEIAAILGGSQRATPAQLEAESAAKAGYGTGPEAIAAWRKAEIERNAAEISRLEQQLAQGGAANGAAFANVQARYAELKHAQDTLTENQRQYNESFGADKAKFNTTVSGRDAAGNPTLAGRQQQLDEAKFNWQQAIDARDFASAEKYRKLASDLSQNHLTLDYTSMLNSKKGPEDWVDYWYQSRGMTAPRGAQSIPLEQAVPAWAQPQNSYADRLPTSPPPPAPGAGAPGAGGSAAAPAAAAAGTPRGVMDLPHSTFGAPPNPVAAAPQWAHAGYVNDENDRLTRDLGGIPKGAVVAAGENGVPVSLSDWAVANARRQPAWAGLGA